VKTNAKDHLEFIEPNLEKNIFGPFSQDVQTAYKLCTPMVNQPQFFFHAREVTLHLFNFKEGRTSRERARLSIPFALCIYEQNVMVMLLVVREVMERPGLCHLVGPSPLYSPSCIVFKG